VSIILFRIISSTKMFTRNGLHYSICFMLVWENLNISDNCYLPFLDWDTAGVNDLQISKLENLCQCKNNIISIL
jgi:hypothetical protein